MKTPVLGTLFVLLLIACTPLHAAGEISESQALELANREIVKYHVDPKRWEVQIDKTLEEWRRKRHSWEEWLKNTNETWPRRRIEEIETAIKGRKVWLVIYDLPVPPGKQVLHTHAIVFLDVDKGEVLSVIHPEE